LSSKFYCPNALADINQRIQISKKILLSCVPTPSPYVNNNNNNNNNNTRLCPTITSDFNMLYDVTIDVKDIKNSIDT